MADYDGGIGWGTGFGGVWALDPHLKGRSAVEFDRWTSRVDRPETSDGTFPGRSRHARESPVEVVQSARWRRDPCRSRNRRRIGRCAGMRAARRPGPGTRPGEQFERAGKPPGIGLEIPHRSSQVVVAKEPLDHPVHPVRGDPRGP